MLKYQCDPTGLPVARQTPGVKIISPTQTQSCPFINWVGECQLKLKPKPDITGVSWHAMNR